MKRKRRIYRGSGGLHVSCLVDTSYGTCRAPVDEVNRCVGFNWRESQQCVRVCMGRARCIYVLTINGVDVTYTVCTYGGLLQ